jgi:hypothetical protein
MCSQVQTRAAADRCGARLLPPEPFSGLARCCRTCGKSSTDHNLARRPRHQALGRRASSENRARVLPCVRPPRRRSSRAGNRRADQKGSPVWHDVGTPQYCPKRTQTGFIQVRPYVAVQWLFENVCETALLDHEHNNSRRKATELSGGQYHARPGFQTTR